MSAFTDTSATLTWTASGDDGNSGRAAQYDLRYYSSPINQGNWASASLVIDEPTPNISGNTETYIAHGLTHESYYYFAIKVSDEVPNWSSLSNVAEVSTVAIDTTSPSCIEDLAVSAFTDTSATLTWTASGDDGISGRAAQYDLRFYSSPINQSNWASAWSFNDEPAPNTSGIVESYAAYGLAPDSRYYFALRVSDDASNWSTMSNVATVLTTELVPPATITDLQSTPQTAHSIELTWTAPGDDGMVGTASYYDVRYSTNPLDETNWQAAQVAVVSIVPGFSGTSQLYLLDGLAESTTYYIAVKTGDDWSNWSEISNVVVDSTLEPLTNQDYSGTYSYIEWSGVDTAVDTSQAVELTFREPDFAMDINPAIPESLRVFCDVLGECELTGYYIRLSVVDSNYTRGVCTQNWAPGGFFLWELLGDSLILTRDTVNAQGNRTIRSLRLSPVE